MQTTWQRRLFLLMTLCLVPFLVSACTSSRPKSTPASPSAHPERQPFELPYLRLPSPDDEAHLVYLGIGDDETFALAEIKTRILIIEVFNFYCPHCQAEAPTVNRLYSQIESDARLRGQIKIIGIGIGNTSYEVRTFRQRFAVPFPLFADRSRVISKQLEVRQTPTFIAWRYHPDGRIDPILFAPGPVGETEQFLNQLVQASGLELPPGG